MTDIIPTHLLVKAQARTAATHGVPVTVLRKGDPENGAILLKINTLDGMAEIFTQIWLDDERVWTPHGPPMPEAQADELAAQQASFDPDIWLIEIEDKAARLWFDGRIVED